MKYTLRDKNGQRIPEYGIWAAMKQRCYNPKNIAYARYGGLGVSVYQEWVDSFEAWFDYIGPRPSSAHSQDRYPNKFGNYEPGNVRWATPKEQQRNMRSNHPLVVGEITLCDAEWAEKSGTNVKTIRTRIVRGYTPEQAVFALPLAHHQRRHGRRG